MGETTPTGYKSGIIGFILIIAFLLAGFKWGGGEDPKPVPVKLTCTQLGDSYTCQKQTP